MNDKLELFPREDELANRLFATQSDYEAFWRELYLSVQSELLQQRECATRSIEVSYIHRVN